MVMRRLKMSKAEPECRRGCEERTRTKTVIVMASLLAVILLILCLPATLALLLALKYAEWVAFCLCPGSSLCLFPPVPSCQLLPISQLDCQPPLVALFHLLIQFSPHPSHSLLNTSLSLLSIYLPEILLFLVMCYLFTYMFTVSFPLPQQKVETFRGRID